ncbi:MAG: permease prefix domain 1-containing protein [Anaeromyxobacter sp.]
MTSTTLTAPVEAQIAEWRAYLRRRSAIRDVDVAELEDHLRGQLEALGAAGLAPDEAFLVAVKRMGAMDALSQEFAREHSERLWRQLVAPAGQDAASRARRRELWVAIALGVAAGALVKLPAAFGYGLEQHAVLYLRNASLMVFPLVAGYFAWKRALDARLVGILAAGFLAAAAVVNLYPFEARGDTHRLAILHLPIALWLAVGVAYAGGRWAQVGPRMDFVRFSGELFIYFVLIALGGGVLTGFTMAIFLSIHVDARWFVEGWLLPCGAAGAVLVATWLVEAKQGVVENMAPVLARIFAPLFTAVLLTFVATMLLTGHAIDIEREVLIGFDLLLVLVLGLLLYAISARDPDAPAGGFDLLLVVLVGSALLVDALALAAIVARISGFGLTPNRVAALGENLLLLVNLGGAAWRYGAFLRGRGTFREVEAWETGYLPVFAAWALFVVVGFPLLFRFA